LTTQLPTRIAKQSIAVVPLGQYIIILLLQYLAQAMEVLFTFNGTALGTCDSHKQDQLLSTVAMPHSHGVGAPQFQPASWSNESRERYSSISLKTK
jgi:hypothetical protein